MDKKNLKLMKYEYDTDEKNGDKPRVTGGGCPLGYGK